MAALDTEIVPVSRPFAPTHPDRLAATAALSGLVATPPPEARVLELGCGDGGNIIPMAAFLPEARFLGVDRSEQAIMKGREVAAMLSLSNIELRAAAFDELDSGLGVFDYIICHGVLSWVGDEDRQRLLRLCRDCLGPRGLVVVTYNVRPGWSIRGTLRELLLPRAEAGAPEGAVGRARERARLLLQSCDGQHPWVALLRSELARIVEKEDADLLLDELAGHNVAFTLRELAALVEEQGLAVVDELLQGPFGVGTDASLRETLRARGLRGLELEESIDALSCRFFRASLLCSAERARSASSDEGLAEVPEEWRFAGELRAKAEEPLLAPGKPLSFDLADGTEIVSEHPLLKAALLTLAERWPRDIALVELLEQARAKLRERGLVDDSVSSGAAAAALGRDLQRLARSGRLELRLRDLGAGRPSTSRDRPVVHPLARFQATLTGVVTTPRHTVTPVDALTRLLVRLLDGEHDLAALQRETLSAIARGELAIQMEGDEIVSAAMLQRHLEPMVAGALERLDELGVMIG